MTPATSDGTPSATQVEDELPVQFGAEDALLGIVTPPSPAGTDRPGVILLNAGVIHRVGPHRMNVVLARRFASTGFPAMRYDLGGLGDSKAARGNASFQERAVADTRAAMDWMERAGLAKRFVLFGLCSGADNGLATALADPRVVGLVMIDPYTWVTPRARLRKLEGKVRSLGSARSVAKWGLSVGARLVKQQIEARRAPKTEEGETQNGREAPPPEVFGRSIGTLLDRGVRVLAVYSGALGERYNHEDQLFEVFPELRGRVDRAWFPEANHTFTPRAAQARLTDLASSWLGRHFGRG